MVIVQQFITIQQSGSRLANQIDLNDMNREDLQKIVSDLPFVKEARELKEFKSSVKKFFNKIFRNK